MLNRDQVAFTIAGTFLLANIVVPVVWGDLYPFTSGPMFRDAPTQYCNYRVYGPDGNLLAAEAFYCQRIYDGNPVGYGVGVRPPKVIEEFGTARDEAYCRDHILSHLSAAENRRYPFVEIEQEVIGPIDGEHVGIVKTDRWKVENPHYTGLPGS
ncbi:hypothetical protein ETAA8_60760 [Anatilimnocola aggregata]|uniref:Uncharacterized protein n=1 Tax=Anatilimnocola aggregata TaxID=2528021 RepID=A0A517YL36_9BACT|nr:hypothetical protein [Anatilimnocola aggregata]QDU30923.1 hypothetical protein ETAA8_60760 [Anatilimnocola aggregata]